MKELTIKNFNTGLFTDLEQETIPEDSASNSLNWRTMGDKIELSGGYTIVGAEVIGTGKVTGLSIGNTVSGSKQAFRTRGQKIEYYNNATALWVEVGSNLLTSSADGEDVAITHYNSLAGYQTFISSPNSGLFKLFNSVPTTAKNVFSSAINYKGYIRANNNRLHLWNRTKYKNFLYGSSKDPQTGYTTVTAESIGIAGSLTYTGTLAQVTGTRTCHEVTFTDAVETFSDNKDGTLTGTAGGTGTINYATGAYSVTFNVVTVNPVTSTYQYEDTNSDGITDFRFSSPTRLATEGYFLPQPDIGDLLAVLPYNNEFYCLHEGNAWLFNMPVDDLNPTNVVYRESIGIPNWRAAHPSAGGIYYIDTSNPSEPKFAILQTNLSNEKVEPAILSVRLDLSGFDFSDGVVFEWDRYIIFQGKRTGDTNNNRFFAYNTVYKCFDVFDYYGSVFTDNSGQLWAGDSASNNVMHLFNSYSANGSIINNQWIGKLTDLQISNIKKTKRLTIQGQIQPTQVVKVYIAYDRGGFSEVGEIRGDGQYVDTGSAITVGSQVVGRYEVGGGTLTSDVQAYNYVKEFRIRTTKFKYCQLKFVAQDVGYVSISLINFYDIRIYDQKNITRYRQTS